MTVGERIKKAREYYDISQVDLAKRIGVSKQSLYKYENNVVTNIPSNVIEQIANILDISPCYLMGWEEKETTQSESPEIITYYNQLNTTGKEAATEHVRLLTLDEKYTRPDKIAPITRKPLEDPYQVSAAHENRDATEEDKPFDEDLMDNDEIWS